MSLVSLVVAMADNGVIGADGTLPWRLPDDLRRFKALTMGKPCVMGRRTWDSLPRRPLPGRQNIVVTRDRAFRANGVTVVHSLEEALANAADAEEICVIGGAEIYRAALARADRIHLTEIHADIEGDTRLSRFDRETWRETSREDRKADDGPDFSFVTLERRR